MGCSSNLPAKRGSFGPGLNFVGTRILCQHSAFDHHCCASWNLASWARAIFTIHSSVITSTTTFYLQNIGNCPSSKLYIRTTLSHSQPHRQLPTISFLRRFFISTPVNSANMSAAKVKAQNIIDENGVGMSLPLLPAIDKALTYCVS